MIKVTISANESASAVAALKIASILPFSVVILPSNSDLIAFLSVEADPLNEVIAAALIADFAAAELLKALTAAVNSASEA